MPRGVHGPTAWVPVLPPPREPPQNFSKCHFAVVLTGSPSPSHLPELFFSSCTGGKATASPLQPRWLRREVVLMPESPWALGCDCQPGSSPSAITAIPPRLLPAPWDPIPTFPRWTDPHPCPGMANVRGRVTEAHTSCSHAFPAAMGNNRPPTQQLQPLR